MKARYSESRMNYRNDEFQSGDFVINKYGIKEEKMGVLIKRCDNQPEYWKVLNDGDIVVWFESNMAAINDKRPKFSTSTS